MRIGGEDRRVQRLLGSVLRVAAPVLPRLERFALAGLEDTAIPGAIAQSREHQRACTPIITRLVVPMCASMSGEEHTGS